MAIFNTVPPLNAGAGIKFDGETISTAAAPRNLLDNSDFRNPVNQRGQTSYTGNGYSIDRWKSGSSNSALTVNDGYITITGSNYVQYIPGHKDGTFSAFAKNISGGLVQLATGYDASLSARYVNIPVGSWAWAALYEGEYTAETLPEYQPKGYAAELMECKRYYQVVTGLSCTTDPGCAGVMYYRFDIPMVNIPSLSPTEIRIDIYGFKAKDVTISTDISTTQMWVFYNTGELPGRINRLGTPLTLTADL